MAVACMPVHWTSLNVGVTSFNTQNVWFALRSSYPANCFSHDESLKPWRESCNFDSLFWSGKKCSSNSNFLVGCRLCHKWCKDKWTAYSKMFTNMNFLNHPKMSFRSSTSLKFDSNTSEETDNLSPLQYVNITSGHSIELVVQCTVTVLGQNPPEPEWTATV